MNVHGKWFSSSLGSSLSFIWAACHISIGIIVVPGGIFVPYKREWCTCVVGWSSIEILHSLDYLVVFFLTFTLFNTFLKSLLSLMTVTYMFMQLFP